MATKLSLKNELSRLKKLRFARRSVMYVMRTLLFVTLGAILCIGAFMAAERTSNLYILVTEGMAMRAKCILEAETNTDLQEYFTLTALEQDRDLSAGTYANYTINSYDYDLTVEKISVYPWSVTATVTVLEDVSLKGSINADQLSEEESAADYPLPEWTRMRYNIHFINSNSRWYITQLEVLDVNPPEEPLNTPDPNLTPRPMATPTPAATELPA
ncbi:MAG: hypothetical protein IJF41_02575 [Clostridia bacterium]|nr:hypothetical protein [Clostridia bacterium]